MALWPRSVGYVDNLKTRSNDLRILGIQKQVAPDPVYLFSYLLPLPSIFNRWIIGQS